MNPTEISSCPSCEAALTNAFHRRLNTFWGGVSVADCPNCKATLEFESSLKVKLKRAGVLTRIGIIGFVVSVGLRFLANMNDLVFDVAIGLCLLIFVAGLLMSATKPDQIELVVSRSSD